MFAVSPIVNYIVTAFYKEFFGELKGVAEDGIDFEVLTKPVGNKEITLVTRSVLEGPVSY